jgi:hypothetical protein
MTTRHVLKLAAACKKTIEVLPSYSAIVGVSGLDVDILRFEYSVDP